MADVLRVQRNEDNNYFGQYDWTSFLHYLLQNMLLLYCESCEDSVIPCGQKKKKKKKEGRCI